MKRKPGRRYVTGSRANNARFPIPIEQSDMEADKLTFTPQDIEYALNPPDVDRSNMPDPKWCMKLHDPDPVKGKAMKPQKPAPCLYKQREQILADLHRLKKKA